MPVPYNEIEHDVSLYAQLLDPEDPGHQNALKLMFALTLFSTEVPELIEKHKLTWGENDEVMPESAEDLIDDAIGMVDGVVDHYHFHLRKPGVDLNRVESILAQSNAFFKLLTEAYDKPYGDNPYFHQLVSFLLRLEGDSMIFMNGYHSALRKK